MSNYLHSNAGNDDNRYLRRLRHHTMITLGRKHVCKYLRYARSILIGGVTSLLLAPTVGWAQTLFPWPDSRIDVGQYMSIESCLAAANRVRDSLKARSDTLFDTLPSTVNPGLQPVPTAIQMTVQRCMRRFPVATVPLAKHQLAQQLYLLAGQDGDAAKIIARRLDSISTTDLDQRAIVLYAAIREYLSAAPIRLDSAMRLVDEWTGPTATITWSDRAVILIEMMSASKRCGRTEITHRYAHTILATAEARKDSIAMDPGEQHWFMKGILAANRELYDDMLMDSLRTSSSAYASVKEQKLNGVGVSGTRFPEIQGDFVFPVSAKGERFPRPGALTLFIAMTGSQHWKSNDLFAMNVRIRQLKQRFPALEIVLVTATTGAVVPLVPLSPAEEATILEQMLLDFHKLSVTLLVYNRPFFHLPDPDRRRMNEPTELEKEWSQFSLPGSAILVDKMGVVVEELPIQQDERLLKFVQAVYDRELKSAQAGAR